MSSEPMIQVRQLTKAYQIYDKPIDRLKQMLWHGRRQYYRKFLAVKDVDLEVAPGETVGIVGRNGSGKSTLLKMICGILPATAGSIVINGRIAPLLTLGAGFNPEFTGRENVYLNAAIFGMSSTQIDERYHAIAEFADIGEFIDHPVKLYSSGMQARLAFAVAIHLDPDILVIDEVLSVGDDAFRRKCTARIEFIKQRGATILFVSHSAQSVIELCDRAILIEKGERLLLSDPKTVIAQYHRLLYSKPADYPAIHAAIKALDSPTNKSTDPTQTPDRVASNLNEEAPQPAPSDQPIATLTAVERAAQFERFEPALVSESTVEYASKGVRISAVELHSKSGKTINVVGTRSAVTYTYRVTFEADRFVDHFGMAVKATSGLPLVGLTLRSDSDLPLFFKAGTIVRVKFDLDIRLGPGTYFLNAGVYGFADAEEPTYLHRFVDVAVIRVESNSPSRRNLISYVDLAQDLEKIGSIEVENETKTTPDSTDRSITKPPTTPPAEITILPTSESVIAETKS